MVKRSKELLREEWIRAAQILLSTTMENGIRNAGYRGRAFPSRRSKKIFKLLYGIAEARARQSGGQDSGWLFAERVITLHQGYSQPPTVLKANWK